MTDFDCTQPSCNSPSECLQDNACLSVPERNELARNDRVKQLIAGIRERHGWSAK